MSCLTHTSSARDGALIACAAWLLAWGCSDAPAPSVISVTGDPDQVAAETPSITGRVLDAETSLPIAGAVVDTTPGTDTVKTDTQGRYILVSGVAREQTYTLRAQAEGYVTGVGQVAVGDGKTLHGDLALTPEAVGLETLTFEPESIRFAADQQRVSARVRVAPEQSPGQRWALSLPPSVDWVTVTPDAEDVEPGGVYDIALTLEPEAAQRALTRAGAGARSIQTTLTLSLGDRKLTRDVVAVFDAERARLRLTEPSAPARDLPDRIAIDGLDTLAFDTRATLGDGDRALRDALVRVTLGGEQSVIQRARTNSDGVAQIALDLPPSGFGQPPTLPLTVALQGYPDASRTVTLVREACPIELSLELDDQSAHAPLLYVPPSEQPDASRLQARATASPCDGPGGRVELTLTTEPALGAPMTASLTIPSTSDASPATHVFDLTPGDDDVITATLAFEPRGVAISAPAQITLERLDTDAPLALDGPAVRFRGDQDAIEVTATVQTTAGALVTGLRDAHVELCVRASGANAPFSCYGATRLGGRPEDTAYRAAIPMTATTAHGVLSARVRFAGTDNPRYVTLNDRRCLAVYDDPIDPVVGLSSPGPFLQGDALEVRAALQGAAANDVSTVVGKIDAVDLNGERVRYDTVMLERSADPNVWTVALRDLEPGDYIVEVYATFANEGLCQGTPLPELLLGETEAIQVDVELPIASELLGPYEVNLPEDLPVTVEWRMVNADRQNIDGVWSYRFAEDAPPNTPNIEIIEDNGVLRLSIVATAPDVWPLTLTLDGEDVAEGIVLRSVAAATMAHFPEPELGAANRLRGCVVWPYILYRAGTATPLDISVRWADEAAPAAWAPITRGPGPTHTLRVSDPGEGVEGVFVWDTLRDIGPRATAATLGIDVYDNGALADTIRDVDVRVHNGILMRLKDLASGSWERATLDVRDTHTLAVLGNRLGLPQEPAVALFEYNPSNNTYGFAELVFGDLLPTGLRDSEGLYALDQLAIAAGDFGAADAVFPDLAVGWYDTTAGGNQGYHSVFTDLPPEPFAPYSTTLTNPSNDVSVTYPSHVIAVERADIPGQARVFVGGDDGLAVISDPLTWGQQTLLLQDQQGATLLALVSGRFNHDAAYDVLSVNYVAQPGLITLDVFTEALELDGTFSRETRLPPALGGSTRVRAAVVDWDGDGLDDLIVAGDEEPITLALLPNITSRGEEVEFGPAQPLAALAAFPEELHVADVDGDDRLDAVYHDGSRVRVVAHLEDDPQDTGESLCDVGGSLNPACQAIFDGNGDVWTIRQLLVRDLNRNGRSEVIVVGSDGLALFEAEPPPSRCAFTWGAPETTAPVDPPIAHQLVHLSNGDDLIDLVTLRQDSARAVWVEFERSDSASFGAGNDGVSLLTSIARAGVMLRGDGTGALSHTLTVSDTSYTLAHQGTSRGGALPDGCSGPLRALLTIDPDGDNSDTGALVCSTGIWALDLEAAVESMPGAWYAIGTPATGAITHAHVAALEGDGDGGDDLIWIDDAGLHIAYSAPDARWVEAEGSPWFSGQLTDPRDLHVGHLNGDALPEVLVLDAADAARTLVHALKPEGSGRWSAFDPSELVHVGTPDVTLDPQALAVLRHAALDTPALAVLSRRAILGRDDAAEHEVHLWALAPGDALAWDAAPIPWPNPARTFTASPASRALAHPDLIAVDLDRDGSDDLAVLTAQPVFVHLPHDPSTLHAPYTRSPHLNPSDPEQPDGLCPEAIWLYDDDGDGRPEAHVDRITDPASHTYERIVWDDAPSACLLTTDGTITPAPTRVARPDPALPSVAAVAIQGSTARALLRSPAAQVCDDGDNVWFSTDGTVNPNSPVDLLITHTPTGARPLVLQASAGNLNAIAYGLTDGSLFNAGPANTTTLSPTLAGTYVGSALGDFNDDDAEDLLIIQETGGVYTVTVRTLGEGSIGGPIGAVFGGEVTAAWAGELSPNRPGSVFAVFDAESAQASIHVNPDEDFQGWLDQGDAIGANHTQVATLGSAPIHRLIPLRPRGAHNVQLLALPASDTGVEPAWVLTFGTESEGDAGVLLQAQAVVLGDGVLDAAASPAAPSLYTTQRTPEGTCAVRRLDRLE